jgi:hypothetical protein
VKNSKILIPWKTLPINELVLMLLGRLLLGFSLVLTLVLTLTPAFDSHIAAEVDLIENTDVCFFKNVDIFWV